MAIISFDVDEEIEYTPEYGGNRESDDPCVVTVNFIGHGKVQKYAKMITNKVKGDFSKSTEAVSMVAKKQFCENIVNIQNFIIKGEQVTEPKVLFENAPSALINEILEAMENASKLSEGQIKN